MEKHSYLQIKWKQKIAPQNLCPNAERIIGKDHCFPFSLLLQECNLYGENYNATKSGNEEYDYSTGTKDWAVKDESTTQLI